MSLSSCSNQLIKHSALLFLFYVVHGVLQEAITKKRGFHFGWFITAAEAGVFAIAAFLEASTKTRGEGSGDGEKAESRLQVLDERHSKREETGGAKWANVRGENGREIERKGVTSTIDVSKEEEGEENRGGGEKEGRNWSERKGGVGYFAALSILLVLSQGFGTVAINYVSYPVKVLFKSIKLLPTMLLGRYVVGRTYSRRQYAGAVTLSIGLFLMVVFDVKEAKAEVDLAGTGTAIGVLFLSIASISDALLPNVQEKVLCQLKIQRETMMVRSNAASLCIILVWMGVSGELEQALAFLADDPATGLYLLVQAVCGYLGVRCYLTLMREYGCRVAVLITLARKVVTILLSFLLFPKDVAYMFVSGIALAFAGIALSSQV